MFDIGDFIIYGSMGVCRVSDITTRAPAQADKEQLFYILEPLYQTCTISTPIDNTKVFMRPVISKDEAERLIDMIPSISAEAYHSRVIRQLAEHYQESLKTHDCEELIELTMSIYAKKQAAVQEKKKIGVVDEKYMKRAEELLFGELSVALGIDKDDVPDYIAARVGTEMGS